MKPLKDCSYFKIQEAKERIAREKQMLSYVQSEIIKYEKALKKSDLELLATLDKVYYDGFSWPSAVIEASYLQSSPTVEKSSAPQGEKKKCQHCPYEKNTCQDLLKFKKTRILFLRQKIREATEAYNQLVALLNTAWYHRDFLGDQKENKVIIFRSHPTPSLVCFNRAHFKPSQEGKYSYNLLYSDKKTLQIKQATLVYVYEVSSQALEGTFLARANQTAKLIKVELPIEKIEGLEEIILYGIHEWVKQLNQKFGRCYGPIQGVYIELVQDFIKPQREFIRRIEKLGYQTLGKVNRQGLFEEQRLLIYMEKPLG